MDDVGTRKRRKRRPRKSLREGEGATGEKNEKEEQYKQKQCKKKGCMFFAGVNADSKEIIGGKIVLLREEEV